MTSLRAHWGRVIWVPALLLVLFVTAVVIFGWDWTGFNSKVGPKLETNEQYRAGKSLWDWLQLLVIPAAIAVGTLWLDARRKQAAEDRRIAFQRAEEERRVVFLQYEDIHKYAQDQYAALITGYLRLYEGEGATAEGKVFGHLAYLADKDIMRPYRLNETLLDDQLRSRVFIIHNVLAQVQGSPSEATLKNFRSWKLEFYEEISYIRTLLQPEELLYRKGILSRPFDTPIGGSP